MPVAFEKCTNAQFIKVIVLTTMLVSLLGYVDRITGEISIDILYVLCIGLASWHTNIFGGILCVAEIVIAKTAADHFDSIKVGTHLYEWNAINDILIYLVVCILVVKLKKALT